MKKKLYISALLLFMLIAGGWAFNQARIVTKNNEPLIDLNAILTPNISPSVSETTPAEDSDNKTEQNYPKVEITINSLDIVVSNTSISCMGRSYSYDREKDEIADFDRVIDLASKSKQIEIIDEYAEAHAINCVRRLIREGTGKEASVKTKAIVEKEAGR